jgi:hypothetical protein
MDFVVAPDYSNKSSQALPKWCFLPKRIKLFVAESGSLMATGCVMRLGPPPCSMPCH